MSKSSRFLIRTGIILCVLVFSQISIPISANAESTSGIYKIYYPIHELSPLVKSEVLSAKKQSLEFIDIENPYGNFNLPDILESVYTINNSGENTVSRVSVPIQGVPYKINLADCSLKLNGDSISPKLYFHYETENYYHPAFNSSGKTFNSLDVLRDAFGDIYDFGDLSGTLYTITPLDEMKEVRIDFELTANQAIYSDGFTSGHYSNITRQGHYTIKEGAYDETKSYYIFTTGDNLEFSAGNATVQHTTLLYNDFPALVRQSASFEKNSTHIPDDFLTEYFDPFASNYLYHATKSSNGYISTNGIINWIGHYRYIFLVYDLTFPAGESEIMLRRPIDYITFADKIYGYDINNIPTQNWTSFGTTEIKVKQIEEMPHVKGWRFDFRKNKTSDFYYFSGNLSALGEYSIFFRADTFSNTFAADITIGQHLYRTNKPLFFTLIAIETILIIALFLLIFAAIHSYTKHRWR